MSSVCENWNYWLDNYIEDDCITLMSMSLKTDKISQNLLDVICTRAIILGKLQLVKWLLTKTSLEWCRGYPHLALRHEQHVIFEFLMSCRDEISVPNLDF